MNNRYVHIGEGKFTGHTGIERPNLIEGVSDLPELESGTVVLTPTKDTTKTQNRFRVVWTAGTEDELNNYAMQQLIVANDIQNTAIYF